MNPSVGYFLAKLHGKLRRDKRKETLNKWFMKRGVTLGGYPEAFETHPEKFGGGRYSTMDKYMQQYSH